MKRFFDYEITGSYYDYVGGNKYRVRYKKKWHLKRKNKAGRKAVQRCSNRKK